MIRPTLVHQDGSVDVVFDETGHTGTLTPDQIEYGKLMDGGVNPDVLGLPCPDGCGSISWHPRDSTEPLVAEMFATKDAL